MENRTPLLLPQGASVRVPRSCFWGLGFSVDTFYITKRPRLPIRKIATLEGDVWAGAQGPEAS